VVPSEDGGECDDILIKRGKRKTERKEHQGIGLLLCKKKKRVGAEGNLQKVVLREPARSMRGLWWPKGQRKKGLKLHWGLERCKSKELKVSGQRSWGWGDQVAGKRELTGRGAFEGVGLGRKN